MAKRSANGHKPPNKTASKRPGAGNGGVVPPVETRFGPGNQAAVGHGRPRKLAELKELILETLAEEVTGQTPEGLRVTMTRAQQMIRTMLLKSPSDRIALLEYGFGKIAQPFKWEDDLAAWLRDNAETLRTDAAERARVVRILREGGHDYAALFASVGLEAIVTDAD